jgi:uncharacterized protein (DUF1501 family)
MSDPMDGHGRGCGCAGGTRRDLLRAAAGAAGIAALGPFRGLLPTAAGSPLPLKRMIVVNLFGGNDTLNMVVPHTLSNYYTRRPGIAIPSASAIALSGAAATNVVRLHPSMPKIAALWAEGSVAAVQRVGYPRANLSHFTSQDIFSLGVRDGFASLGGTPSGWLARYADGFAPTPMGAVALGVGRPLDFEGGTTPPFLANDLANFRFSLNGNSAAQVHRLEAAKGILADWAGTGNASEARKSQALAYELADQVQAALAGYASGVTYSTATISRRLKDVAVLVQGGFETRIFFTGYGGFDTHSAQGTSTGAQATLFAQLDDGIGSLAEDLKAMGVWNDTVIVVLTEFGRRNFENGSAGTDHGHAFAELVIGGPVSGGLHGPSLTETDLAGNHPDYAVDFRSVYREILSDHLAADPDVVFPEPLEVTTNLGLL